MKIEVLNWHITNSDTFMISYNKKLHRTSGPAIEYKKHVNFNQYWEHGIRLR